MDIPPTTTQRRRHLTNNSIFAHPDPSQNPLSTDRSRTIQEVKRELARKVRTDWEFKWSGGSGVDTMQKHLDDSLAGEGEKKDAEARTEWRERDFSSPEEPCSKHVWSSNLSGADTEMRTREKRRRRRGLLEDEMSWNTGLRHWMAQRDAWTGARLRRVYHHHHDTLSPVGGEAHPPNTTEATPAEVEMIEEVPMPSAPLLSISARLRDSMTPEVRSQIYSKVVIRSMTPRTPLNLADVTDAIVAGWKADGLWPPKSGVEEKQQQQTKTVQKKIWSGPAEKLEMLAGRVGAGRGG